MQRYTQTLIYGFAIFAMFFGSGNLVFPLQIGYDSGAQWLLGFFGLFMTGIILPFLGLFVIKLHQGNYYAFFAEAGKIAKFVLPLFTLSLLGSFGVVPRCITVAHGGIEYLFPQVSLFGFSVIFSVACFLMCVKDNLMITVLGKWMTPLLLGCLFLLIFLGVSQAPICGVSVLSKAQAFQRGFLCGYETMDLFAAFFFSSLVFGHIQKRLDTATQKDILKAALAPSLIGILFLGIIYLGFVFLGAHYGGMIKNVSPELMLPTIADHLMGKNAMFVISTIVVFSCLTTAVALNNIYAHYLCDLFKVKKKNFLWVLLLATGISFCVSLMDFRGIAAILGPLLEMSYPSIILLTVLRLFLKDCQKSKTILFYGVLIVTLGWEIF